MKTREEIAKELAAKRETEHLSEEITELKSIFSHFLSDFKALDTTINHSYALSDEVALNELKNAINRIPSEFKVVHTTDKVSHKFLWWHFGLSFLAIFTALAIGFYYYSNTNELTEQAYKEGLKQGQKNVYGVLPKSSQKYLREKYPKVFGIYK